MKREWELQTAASAVNHKKKKRRWKKLVTVLGCGVVFITTYALILPAVTMTDTACCGLAEHTHTETCCERPLLCPYEEKHVHTGDCYTEVESCSCGLEESETHQHGADCFVTETVLSCSQPEGHVHSEECYGEPELVCGLEEHLHTEVCYSDSNADIEGPEDWAQLVGALALTGDRRADVAAVAVSQLGYNESADNFILDENGSRSGYTRYGAWYGTPYAEWNTLLAAFCVRLAGVPEEVFPVSDSCALWVSALAQQGLYSLIGSDYLPLAGDIIFLDPDGDGFADEVGIVTAVSEATEAAPAGLTLVKGGNGSCVMTADYAANARSLLGCGRIPEEPAANEPAAETATELVFEGPDYTVTLRCTEDAGLPADTQLQVREILPEEEAYAEYYRDAEAALRGRVGQTTITGARLFDITLLSGGEVLEPAAAVEVEIRYADGLTSGEDTSYTAVHFGANGTELIDAAPVTSEDGVQGFAYEQSSFSVTMFLTSEPPATAAAPLLAGTGTGSTDISGFGYSKTIDYLGEGTNSDTTLNGKDFYRLYLDITGYSEPIDLVIVIDQSSSMINNNCILDGVSDTRLNSLKKFLTGYTVNEKTVAGFVDRFMDLNSKNKIAVVGYAKTMMADYGWYTNTTANRTACKTNINSLGYESGTNYEAGFKRAYDKLTNSAVKNDGQKKVVLFLSDGEPTVYFGSFTNPIYDFKTVTSSTSTTNIAYVGGNKDTGGKFTQADVDHMTDVTWEIYQSFHNTFPDVDLYTIGMIEPESTGEPLLIKMATDATYGGHGMYFNAGSDITDMMKKLTGLFAANEIVISDVLSKFVRFYETQPDVRVTMKTEAGAVTTLYENGSVTAAGSDKVSTVVYVAGDTKAIPTASTGTVTATMIDSYPLCNGSTYTLSFNVKATQTTYDYYEYYQKSYNNTEGDAGTDYTGNTTSSEKDGFYSNDEAKVTFNFKESSAALTYDHPVVQARFTDSATSANYTVLEKRFTGLPADRIPADFTVTAVSQTDPTLQYTLTAANTASQTVEGSTIVWRWTLEGASAGTYVLSETGAGVTNYTLTTKYNGGDTTTIAIAARTVTGSRQNPITSVQNLSVTASGTPVFIGKTKSGDSVVIAENRLPSSVRAGIESMLRTSYSTKWSNSDIFHYFETYSADLLCGGESITYSASAHQLTLAAVKNWDTVVTAWYDADEVEATPELRIANDYVVNVVSMTVKNETPSDPAHVFTYTASYSLSGSDPVVLTGFTLKDGEQYVIENLPVGAVLTVTEGDHEGFYVYVHEGTDASARQASDTYTTAPMYEDSEMTFFNNPGVEMPSTGGSGTLPFLLGGAVLLFAAGVLLVLRRSRRFSY